ncbi:carbon-nitrogen family hydrolase [Saccharibacillus sp. JS10]|uniref:carbon-nitrogen family hydrolase n=1 Tax=Saccharibacillus sp. JS10 TaxID=2950552 RepID=UPI00210A0A90|nr:carbon-nitrogen family hydrolase [Saccharibacillus sp. JS10]MCQ4086500.1 carbon-nitrogen family hydrolase [Saccharibacillus sp. JS10]
MTTWKVTCIQYDVVYGDPDANYARVEELIEEAMQDKPDVIVLPELWTIGYDLERLSEIAEQDAERCKAFLSETAKRHNVHLVGGSTAKQNDEGVYNTMLVYDRTGKQVSEYDKAHLITLMDEHIHLKSGSEAAEFKLDEVKSAGVICYDIRFPEWIRAHMSGRADVLFVVAEWPVERLEHWRALLIARAIENQCWVIACNRSGTDPDHDFTGHSMIIGPWGDIVAEAGKSETLLTAQIDLTETQKARKQIPVFDDRRPELYFYEDKISK